MLTRKQALFQAITDRVDADDPAAMEWWTALSDAFHLNEVDEDELTSILAEM